MKKIFFLALLGAATLASPYPSAMAMDSSSNQDPQNQSSDQKPFKQVKISDSCYSDYREIQNKSINDLEEIVKLDEAGGLAALELELTFESSIHNASLDLIERIFPSLSTIKNPISLTVAFDFFKHNFKDPDFFTAPYREPLREIFKERLGEVIEKFSSELKTLQNLQTLSIEWLDFPDGFITQKLVGELPQLLGVGDLGLDAKITSNKEIFDLKKWAQKFPHVEKLSLEQIPDPEGLKEFKHIKEINLRTDDLKDELIKTLNEAEIKHLGLTFDYPKQEEVLLGKFNGKLNDIKKYIESLREHPFWLLTPLENLDKYQSELGESLFLLHQGDIFSQKLRGFLRNWEIPLNQKLADIIEDFGAIRPDKEFLESLDSKIEEYLENCRFCAKAEDEIIPAQIKLHPLLRQRNTLQEEVNFSGAQKIFKDIHNLVQNMPQTSFTLSFPKEMTYISPQMLAKVLPQDKKTFFQNFDFDTENICHYTRGFDKEEFVFPVLEGQFIIREIENRHIIQQFIPGSFFGLDEAEQ